MCFVTCTHLLDKYYRTLDHSLSTEILECIGDCVFRRCTVLPMKAELSMDGCQRLVASAKKEASKKLRPMLPVVAHSQVRHDR